MRTSFTRLLSLVGIALPLAGVAAGAWADQPRDSRTAPTLSLTRQGNVIAGRLTGAEGRAVAGASVTVAAVDAGARTDPTMRSVSGTTPADAAGAIVGIRVGREGACVCDGEAGAVIGDMRYQEKRTGVPLVEHCNTVYFDIDARPVQNTAETGSRYLFAGEVLAKSLVEAGKIRRIAQNNAHVHDVLRCRARCF
jgi:hypothetical protein